MITDLLLLVCFVWLSVSSVYSGWQVTQLQQRIKELEEHADSTY